MGWVRVAGFVPHGGPVSCGEFTVFLLGIDRLPPPPAPLLLLLLPLMFYLPSPPSSSSPSTPAAAPAGGAANAPAGAAGANPWATLRPGAGMPGMGGMPGMPGGGQMDPATMQQMMSNPMVQQVGFGARDPEYLHCARVLTGALAGSGRSRDSGSELGGGCSGAAFLPPSRVLLSLTSPPVVCPPCPPSLHAAVVALS